MNCSISNIDLPHHPTCRPPERDAAALTEVGNARVINVHLIDTTRVEANEENKSENNNST
jgi:hypothetical protein